ncbi:MAG: DUF6232 family protein, partial [Hyphomicrobiaceae bacterium]
PPMWWLEAAEADNADVDLIRGEDVLRFGSQFVGLDDIVSYRVVEVVERSKDRLAINAALAGLAGAVLLIAMMGFGWLEQLLAGFVFLLILGVSSLGEMLGFNSKRFVQVTVFTHSGSKARYACADNREAGQLIGFLEETLCR